MCYILRIESGMTNLDYAIKLVKDRKIEITPEEIQDRRWDVHGLNNLSKQLTMWREAKGFETNKSNFASKIALHIQNYLRLLKQTEREMKRKNSLSLQMLLFVCLI